MLPIGYMCALCFCLCVKVTVNADVCMCLCSLVLNVHFCQAMFWMILKKAEKSRTRTYGPLSVFQLTKEGEFQEPLKKWEQKSKAREFKNNINTAK